jgi:hypothetical protein
VSSGESDAFVAFKEWVFVGYLGSQPNGDVVDLVADMEIDPRRFSYSSGRRKAGLSGRFHLDEFLQGKAPAAG